MTSTTAPTVSILAGSQPLVGGFTALVTTQSTSVVSFYYIIYPGNNVSGNVPSVPNSLYNRTVQVGSSQCANVGGNNYSLLIDSSVCLPNYDYYVIVSALYSDGVQSEYSEADLLPLSAAKITLSSTSVSLTRSTATYNTEALIRVLFTPPQAPVGSTISYTLGIQYIDGNATNQFVLAPGLVYNSSIGGVEYTLTDSEGIDEAYVAIQSVRLVSGVSATSELSNTVMAKDTDIPDPPRNLAIDYQYYQVVPVSILTWLAPYSAVLTDVSGFQVYRKVGSAPYVAIGSPVPFTTLGATYTYSDDTIGAVPLGTTVSYYVKSINPNTQSIPSNIVTIVTLASSTPPLNLNALGLQVTYSSPFEQDVRVIFTNPNTVNGNTSFGYDVAEFVVDIVDNNPTNVGTYQTVIATTNVVYSSSASGYTATFNNIDKFPASSVAGLYIARARLDTFDQDGNTVIGQTASTEFLSGPRPIISLINGTTNEWTYSTPLQSFVATTGQGAPLVDCVITIQNTVTGIYDYHRPTIPTPSVDSLGNWSYTFNSPGLPTNTIAISICAINMFGANNDAAVITGTAP